MINSYLIIGLNKSTHMLGIERQTVGSIFINTCL